MATLDNYPYEIKLSICRFLTFTDLISMQKVNRCFNHLASLLRNDLEFIETELKKIPYSIATNRTALAKETNHFENVTRDDYKINLSEHYLSLSLSIACLDTAELNVGMKEIKNEFQKFQKFFQSNRYSVRAVVCSCHDNSYYQTHRSLCSREGLTDFFCHPTRFLRMGVGHLIGAAISYFVCPSSFCYSFCLNTSIPNCTIGTIGKIRHEIHLQKVENDFKNLQISHIMKRYSLLEERKAQLIPTEKKEEKEEKLAEAPRLPHGYGSIN